MRITTDAAIKFLDAVREEAPDGARPEDWTPELTLAVRAVQFYLGNYGEPVKTLTVESVRKTASQAQAALDILNAATSNGWVE